MARKGPIFEQGFWKNFFHHILSFNAVWSFWICLYVEEIWKPSFFGFSKIFVDFKSTVLSPSSGNYFQFEKPFQKIKSIKELVLVAMMKFFDKFLWTGLVNRSLSSFSNNFLLFVRELSFMNTVTLLWHRKKSEKFNILPFGGWEKKISWYFLRKNL